MNTEQSYSQNIGPPPFELAHDADGVVVDAEHAEAQEQPEVAPHVGDEGASVVVLLKNWYS